MISRLLALGASGSPERSGLATCPTPVIPLRSGVSADPRRERTFVINASAKVA
jgi:hypothetical protein